MPTNLYGPNDNYDLETSHVLPALIRKFHLAKLAAQGDWEGIEKDESLYGPIPEDLRSSLGLSNFSITASQPVVTIWGTGSPKREFLHVEDLADACLFLMDNYNGDEIINIGAGKEITVRDLADLIKEVVGFEGSTNNNSSKPDGTPRKLLDVNRLGSLGWHSTISLKEGIERTYVWYLKKQN